MLDAWRNRTRDWLARGEKLLPLPEQEFAGWALSRIAKSAVGDVHGSPPATICGEEGAGKTSLVRQALRQVTRAGRRKIILAEATEWVCWLKRADADGIPGLSAKQADVVICENLHRLDDPSADGDRLASWLDTARRERIAAVFTADGMPARIRDLSQRLRNRLRGGILSTIRPLSQQSQQRLAEFWISQGVISPAASSPTIDPALTTAGRLQAWLAGELSESTATNEADHPDAGVISLELVAELVASDFQVPVEQLCSGDRAKGMHTPRQVAMALARELTNQSLTKIGRHFGGRSHTSVVRSCTRLQELLPDAPSLRQQVQQLRVKLRRQMSAECG